MFRRFATIFLLFSHLYISLLIGGGRGPFGLYNSYWGCHCGDSNLEIHSASVDPYRPALLGSDLLTEESTGNDSQENEMCRAPRSTESLDMTSPDICPKKMPLRYLSLLLEGSHFIQTATPQVLPRTTFNYLYLVFHNEDVVLSGHPDLTSPPPRQLS